MKRASLAMRFLAAVLFLCLPLVAQQPVVPGSILGTGTVINSTNGTLNATFPIVTNTAAPAVLVQLDQTTTITAGAIRFQVSFDGTNYVNISSDAVIDPTSNTQAAISMPYTLQASTNKAFLVLMKGAQSLQILVSTAMTGTGTITPFYSIVPTWTAQKVNILGNAGAAFDAAEGATPPANDVAIGAEYTSTITGALSNPSIAKPLIDESQTLRTMSGGSAIIFFNAVSATGVQSQNLHVSSAVGTLYVNFSAGITGSPSGCHIQLNADDLTVNIIESSASFSITPTASGRTAIAVYPNFVANSGTANIGSAWNINVLYACTVYPSAGTISAAFIPVQSVSIAGMNGNGLFTDSNGSAYAGLRDPSGNAITDNSSTFSSKFAIDENLLGTLGTAFSTPGKVDVKGADGDVFVRQATGSNLHIVCDSGCGAGSLSNNNAAPTSNNTGVLPAIANTSQQTWTNGDQVLESTDLHGNQRMRIQDAAGNDRGVNVTSGNAAQIDVTSVGGSAVNPSIDTTLNSNAPNFTKGPAQPSAPSVTTTLSPTSGVMTWIQKAVGTGSGSQASLATSSFTNSTGAGNSLVALVGVGNNGTVKLSNTQSDSWTQDVCVANSTTFQFCIFHASNIKGGTNACTVTPSASVSLAIECYEVVGMIGYGGGGDPVNNSTANQQGSVETTAFASGTSTTPASGVTTNSYANGIAFGGFAIGTANQTPTAFNPWSKDQDIAVGGSPSGLFGMHAFSQPLGDGGENISFTATITSEPWAAAIAIFVPVHQNVDGNLVLETSANNSGASLRCTLVSAASTNATNCKANPGNIYGFRFINTTTTIYYLRMYNLATAPTCSSATGFIETIPIPPAGASGQAGGMVSIEPFGEGYSAGIGFCFTGGSSSTDNTNAATGVFGTILYK